MSRMDYVDWKEASDSAEAGADLRGQCKHCGGPIEIRNPRGDCDHLYWPDMLTDEAKRANGLRMVERTVTTWEQE